MVAREALRSSALFENIPIGVFSAYSIYMADIMVLYDNINCEDFNGRIKVNSTYPYIRVKSKVVGLGPK